MATQNYAATVQGFYVAYYGRWADPAGLDYWTGVLAANGGDASVMINDFGDSAEFLNTYSNYLNGNGTIINPAGLITQLYQNMFGRDPDAGGLEFYSNLLATGGSTLAEIALDIFNGAQGQDVAILNNKIAVADFSTATLRNTDASYTEADIPSVRSILAEVNESPASIVPAQQAAAEFITASTGVATTFTLTDIEPEDGPLPILMWGYTPANERGGPDDTSSGIPAMELLNFLQGVTDIDVLGMGLQAGDIEGVTISDLGNAEGSEVTINLVNGQLLVGAALLGPAYLDFIENLLFDADGNSRLYYGYPDQYAPEAPPAGIVLTPTQNNGGTVETGFTTSADDTIVVGRLELLHGAYIDAGEGTNTLEIDAKGTYAQPLQLLNIQHISVQNLPNVYDNAPGVGSRYPDLADHPAPALSVVDLSRAASIQSLTVTEGWDNSPFGVDPGSLSIVGIRNGVTTRLEGGFSQDLFLHYGRDQGTSITLELNLGDTEGFNLNVAQNTNTLNLVSEGFENWLESGYFGGNLRNLNISGEGALYIQGDLDESFADGRPATIDASANTGGVDITLNYHGDGPADPVKFYGTIDGDQFTALGSANAVIRDVDGGADNTDNFFDVSGSVIADIISGEGDDNITADNITDTLTIDAGDGDNVVNADTFAAASITIAAGDGDNIVNASSADSVEVTTGSGDDTVRVIAEEIEIVAGAGDDEVSVSGAPVTATTTEVDLMVDLGAGNNTLTILDHPPAAGTRLDARDGSVISGENITLIVEGCADLTRVNGGQDLSDISSVILAGEAPLVDGAGGLWLTVEQFQAIGAEAFSVDRASFGETQNLHVIVDDDLSMDDLLNGAELEDNVRLNIEIRDGAVFTLTAEQLHNIVARGGIDVLRDADAGQPVTFGSVVIENAGLTFDAFDQNAFTVNGLPAGSLAHTFPESEVTILTAIRGFERPLEETPDNVLVVDADALASDPPEAPIVTTAATLKITGAADLDMSAAPVTMDYDNFVIDFSTDPLDLSETPPYTELSIPGYTGILTGLTLVDFHTITVGTDPDLWGEVLGNGPAADPVRIDVELDGNVANAANGLKTSGVQTYVVTELNDADREFWSSEPTLGVETLGLQGNQGFKITFGDVKWGVGFLLEGDGAVDWEGLPKADGNPNLSNVGTLIGNYFLPGAYAVVEINNGDEDTTGDGSDGAPRPIAVDGIVLDNAGRVTINVTDGNAIIANLSAAIAEKITITGDGDVATWLGTDSIDADLLTAIDASGVTGTAVIGIGNAPADMTGFSFDPADFDGAGLDIDLSGVGENLTGVDAIAIAKDAVLTLSLVQLDALTLVPAFDPAVDTATLNLNGLGDQEFSLGDLPEGIVIGTITVADDDVVTLNPLTDLTGVPQLIVPAGTTLNLTAAQFNQLTGDAAGIKIVVEGTADTAGSVNITDLRQEDVVFTDASGAEQTLDLGAITSPLAITGTLTLAPEEEEDVTFGELVQGGPNVVANLGNFDIVLDANQDITFVAPTQVVRNITGDAATSTVAFAFNYGDLLDSGLTVDFGDGQGPLPGCLDLSGYEGISELNVWNTLVQAQNVEQVLALLTGETVVDINEPPEGFETTVRVVTIQPGVLVDGGLIFEDGRPFWEVTEVDISLLGGVEVSGAVDVSNLALDQAGFETLTLRSSGDLPNTMGDLRATDNNLLDVVVEASQDLEVATVFMTSVDPDGEAALAVTTTAGAEVLIAQVDTNANISDLTISHDGDGTLVIPGTDAGDVGLDLAGADSLTLEGDGAMVFGDWELNNLTAAQTAGIDGNGVLKVLDASGLSGALDLGHVGGLDATDFSLTSGTGLTTLVLHDATLNADEDAGQPGWRFDFSDAAAGSEFRLGAGLDLQQGALSIDLGANTTLVLTEDIDFTGVDLEILQTLDIVVEAGVTVTMTAAQASGLNIVPAADVILDPEDPDYDPADVPVVNIVELGTAAYDLSGVAEGIAGTTRLAADDVTLAEATDLGAFSVTLDDLGAPLAGQTIRFRTEEQAGREIIIDNPAAFDDRGTNVVWLFPTVPPMTQVDTDDYSPELGRLWIPDEVVDGRNVEDLYTSLSSSIIVRVVNTADLDDLLEFEGTDRTVEVESFTQLPAGLIFDDEDLLEGVVDLTLILGGQVTMGDLVIENILDDPEVSNPDDARFQTLTIDSRLPVPTVANPTSRDDYTDGFLLPEDFVPGENPNPSGPNVVGNIHTQTDAFNLNSVTINATGVAFEAQTITFEDTVAGATAFFTVTGGEDVTVKSLDTSDPEITTLSIDTTGSTGTLTVTGGSPAAAVGATESLLIETGFDATVLFGTSEATGAPFAGVAGAALSAITVTGVGTVDLGIVASIDSMDFALIGNGNTTLVLGEANVDDTLTAPAPALAADGTWSFANAAMTLTDVTFGAGSLSLTNIALTIAGDVDLSTLAEDDAATPEREGLDIAGGSIEVLAGASLTLTAVQASGLVITGAGTVNILALEDAPDADLSGIMTGAEDTGTVTAALDSTDDVTLTGNLGIATVTITGNGTVDITADQADELVATGAGTVAVEDLGAGPDDIDLSGLTATTVTAAVDSDTTLGEDADLGTAVVTVAAGATLTADAGVLDGVAVDGDGDVVVNLGTEPVNLGGIEVDGAATAQIPADVDELTLDAATDLGTLEVVVGAGKTLTLTGAQANERSISGPGSVVITDVNAGDDLSGITVTGDLAIQAAEGETELTVTAVQANGNIVEGFEGTELTTVTVTAFEDALDADLGGVNATNIDVELDSSDDPVILAAAVLGTATVAVSGNGTVTVETLADRKSVV